MHTQLARFWNPFVRTFSTSFSAADLSIKRTSNPKTKPDNEDLVFGKQLTDHILEVDWNKKNGWSSPVIKPYYKFEIDPAALCLHYAIECFEGMKAYKDINGKIRLFRPMENMKRMNASARRIALPTYEPEIGVELIKEFLKVEQDWIPQKEGYSLYLRPTMIGTQGALGVQPTAEAKWYVIASPVGPYYKSGFKPVKLLASDKHVRAWPGGVGEYKLGANYAPGILPQLEASSKGYAQILWLLGDNHSLTEVGTMNLFVYWLNAKGERELVTAPIDGTILPGVTRSSVIELAKEWGEKVVERALPMGEFLEALKANRIIECFGAGTACVISPINGIHYKDKDYDVPLDINDPGALAGPFASKLTETILAIQYGKIDHPWSILVE